MGGSPKCLLPPVMSDLSIGHPCRHSGHPDIKDSGPSLSTPKTVHYTFSTPFQTGPCHHPDPNPGLLETSDPHWLRPKP